MNNDPDARTSLDLTPKTTETPAVEPAPIVQPSFAPPPPVPVVAPVKPKRSRKVIIGAIIAAVIVVLGAGSALGYTMWYQNPDKVVHDAVLNMIKAKTMSSTGSVVYEGEGVRMDLSLDGKLGEVNGELSVDAKVTIDTEGMKQDFNAKGSGRFVDDTLYFKVSGIKSVVEDTMKQSNGQIPEYASTIFDKIEDKWISIKASDYQDVDEDISKQQTCFTDLSKKFESNDSMSKEVMQLYRKNQIIVIKEKVGSKSINGVGSLGYRVEIDKNATASFASGLNGTNLGKALKECNKDIDFNKIAEGISGEKTETKELPTIELWASQFGHEITQASILGNMDENKTLNIVLQPTFNKEVTVEAPSDATSIKTVLEEIQQAIMDYYMEMFSAGGTMPAGFGDGINPQLQSAI